MKKKLLAMVLSITMAVGSTSFLNVKGAEVKNKQVESGSSLAENSKKETPDSPTSKIDVDNNNLFQDIHYLIDSPEDLERYRYEVNVLKFDYRGTVTLNSNIDMKGTTWNEGIGDFGIRFKGTFEGGNYSISNLNINSDKYTTGFYGFAQNAKINNLILNNVNINGKEDTGGLIGHNIGSVINNCHVSGNVKGDQNVGGFIGYNNGGRISSSEGGVDAYGNENVGGLIGSNNKSDVLIDSSRVNCKISGNKSVGGIIGFSDKLTTITNCSATIKAKSKDNVGGVVGKVQNQLTLYKSYSQGYVEGENSNIGGLVGISNGKYLLIDSCYSTAKINGSLNLGGLLGNAESGSVITNCYSTGDVISTGRLVGGLVGLLCSSKVINCYSIGKVKGVGGTVGGLVGGMLNSVVENSWYNKETSGQLDTEKGTPLLTSDMLGYKATMTMKGFNFKNTWGTWDKIEFSSFYPYLLEFGRESAPRINDVNLEINTKEELTAFRDDVNSGNSFKGKLVILNNDLDFTGIVWNCGIGNGEKKFEGAFDGMNHKVSNLRIKSNDKHYIGLFGYTYKGQISNIGVENIDANGKTNVGGLIGKNSFGVVENCYTTGKISGNNTVGGLVGDGTGEIYNCYSTASVEANDIIGGLAGCSGFTNLSIIKSCYAAGKVSAKNNSSVFIGGLIGNKSGSNIETSYYDLERTTQSDKFKGIGLKTEQMKGINAKANMKGLEFSTTWDIKENDSLSSYYPYLHTFGESSAQSTDEPLKKINTKEELIEFRNDVNTGNTYERQLVLLGADIDLKGEVWDKVIGNKDHPFKGEFDGDNYTLSNLNINEEEINTGLFGYVEGGEVKNFGVENIKVKGLKHVGGLIGKSSNSKIKNCYVTGKVSGEDTVGGIVGGLENGSAIKDCYSKASVEGYNSVGGIAGYSSATIEDCCVAASVKVKATFRPNVGGIVGLYNLGRIINSYYDKEVTGCSDVGKGEGLQTSQMIGIAAKENMKGFDFEKIWGVKDTNKDQTYYPYLLAFGVDKI